MPVEVWDSVKKMKIGTRRKIVVNIRNNLSHPVTAAVSLDTPENWSVVPRKYSLKLPVGSSNKLKFTVDVPKRANLGSPVNIRLVYDGRETSIRSNIKLVKIKTRVGYIGGLKVLGRYLDTSLTKYGIAYSRIDDVSKAELSKYNIIYVGCAAHKCDAAGIAKNYKKMLEYIHQGGMLVIFLINDERWNPKYLPYKLLLSDTNGKTGKIACPKSKLFSSKYMIKNVAGMIEYDTIEHVGDEWTVLATNTAGKPSILEADLGTGHILICQPAVERYYANAEIAGDPEKKKLYRLLFENIVEYAELWAAKRSK